MIVGLIQSNCVFWLHEGCIKMERVVALLKALKAHLKQLLLTIWGGVRAQRSRLERNCLRLEREEPDGFLEAIRSRSESCRELVREPKASCLGEQPRRRSEQPAHRRGQQAQERPEATLVRRCFPDACDALVMS